MGSISKRIKGCWKIKITLTNIIKIKDPDDSILKYCKNELTFSNPDYIKKKRMGFWVGKTPKELKLYDIYNGDLYLPLGCFDDIWKLHPIKKDYDDYSVSVPRDIKSNIQLREYQKPCSKALVKYVNGLFVLPAGTGKTIIGLECAAELKQHTLWLTHTKELLEQAKQRCEDNLSCTTSVITSGKCNVRGDIVFATVQTLVNKIDKGEIKQDEFGLIIVDECFPKGTKIDTPTGFKNIEDLKIGDYVYSYNHNTKKVEPNKINYLFNKKYEDVLINIKLNNGKSIMCTPNHPIFTKDGYVQADSIKKGDYLYEMLFLPTRNRKRELYKRTMESQVGLLSEYRSNILFKKLFSKICSWEFKRIYEIGKRSCTNENTKSNIQGRSTKKSIDNIKKYKPQTKCSWWKWQGYDCSTKFVENGVRKKRFGCLFGVSNTNKDTKRTWLSNLLQSGFVYSQEKINNRSGWEFPSCINSSRARQEKNHVLRKVRVESVTVQEQNHIGKSFNGCRGNYVYNIGVENNNNYFVNNVLVHNCHHLASNCESVMMFEKCVNYFSSRYKLGLTATLHRADGLEKTTTKILGNVLYELRKNDTKDKLIGYYEEKPILEVPSNIFQLPAKIHFINTNYSVLDKDVYDLSDRIVFSKLITDIANDYERNKQILSLIISLNTPTIVISERVGQLHYLSGKTPNSVCVDGKTNKSVREQAMKDMRDGKYNVLFASYSLVAEGVDIPRLKNLVMATPVKDERLVIQSVGRCQRPDGKKEYAEVYDLIDDVSLLDKFTRARKKVYKDEGWEMR